MTQPTQEDVARLAGVSRPLVSLVIRNAPNVSDESRRRVLEAAKQLGYRPNAFARSLASKQVQTIGVLIPDLTNPHFGAVYGSFAEAAERAGYDLLIAAGMLSVRKEPALVNTLLEHRVAGLVLLSPNMRTAELRQLTDGWPSVMIGSRVALPGVDVVTTDEVLAARSVIGRLVELGHREIVHITGGNNRSARDRAGAYRKVMADHGLAAHEVPGSFSQQGGQQGARAILQRGALPTAVIAGNDLIAVGAMGVLRAAGVRVPDDVSVVGYDDSQIAQLDLVQLTSVQQSIERFGDAAMSLLVDRIEHRREGNVIQRIEATLIERRSTGPARSSGRRGMADRGVAG